jgi:hypothetical protein
MDDELRNWFFETAHQEADNDLNDIGHTPGPWVRKVMADGEWVETEEGAAICYFPGWLREVGSDPVPNSVLVKHSPEMYALLHKIMLEQYTRHGAAAVFDKTFQLAIEMIDKIRGEIDNV